MEAIDRDAITAVVRKAIDRLFERDSFLLQSNANERSISHKLPEYLQEVLSNVMELDCWHVDCEYNRDGHDSKQLDLPAKQKPTDDLDARTVYPDIIVHRRDTNENLLVVEIKKSNNPDDGSFDRRKLKAFKCQLRYQHALFVKFKVGTPDLGCEEFEFL